MHCYAFNGVMEVNINQIDYLTPPPYGIWLPPNVAHSSLNRTDVSHGTLYIHESLCTHLPQQAGIMLSSPLVSALFKHLRQHSLPDDAPEHMRLLYVLLDQLHHAELVSSYLPHSEHPTLKSILDFLHPYKFFFILYLSLSSACFILLGALGQRYAAMSFGTILLSLYSMFGLGE